MIKITRESLALTAADRWEEQYRYYKEFKGKNGKGKDEILSELIALGPRPSPEDTTKIIGNDSWTCVPECSECNKENLSFVIRVGEEEDYESMTAYLCEGCIRKLGEYL